MLKKLNSLGFSHHFILPLAAILLVAGIGTYTLHMSSAAATCKGRTFNTGSASECVRDVQHMLGLSADAAYGRNTKSAVKSFQIKYGIKPSDGVLRPSTWSKLCSVKSGKYRNHACLGTKIETPTYGYKVCVKMSYKSPARTASGAPRKPTKPSCATYKVFKGVGSYQKSRNALAAYKKSAQYAAIMSKFNADQTTYKKYNSSYNKQSAPSFTTSPIRFGPDTR